MLFSGGAAIPKKDVKKEKKAERDERLEIQENVFSRWASALTGEQISELKDLADMKHIATVARLITDETVMLSDQRTLEDATAVLKLIPDVKASPSELLEQQQKAVLGIWWSLVQAFWRRFGPDLIREEKLAEALRNWCVECAKAYQGTTISDFTSSWRDGHAFNILLHSFDKKSVDLDLIDQMSAPERLETAFCVAEQKYDVPRLLLPKELRSENLENRSVVTYLMCLYLALISKSNLSSTLKTRPSVPNIHLATLPKQQSAPSAADLSPSSSKPSEERPPELLQHGGSPPKEQPKTLKQQQSTEQPSESVQSTGGRSRKSSSSSQKSSKSKKAKREELAKEFDACLEHVLAWLLEAEEEVAALSQAESSDVASARKRFKEYEKLMCSLTESQETVGRVLHRGHVLSQRVDEQEREAINAQLFVVNTRWEQLRALAMERQSALQASLTALQHEQLEQIRVWLNEKEEEISSAAPLADNPEDTIKQIKQHSSLQKRINDYQAVIDDLATFIAVVDEEEKSEDSVAVLEESLRDIGVRWAAICEWSEKRAQALDGLAQLHDNTTQLLSSLQNWLKTREQELLSLRSAHHLESESEVADQLKALARSDEELEKEHGQLLQLCVHANELVARLEKENPSAAQKIRRQVDTINQRWENLVARIDEHSKMLVRSGKVDATSMRKAFKNPRQTTSSVEEGEEKKAFAEAMSPSSQSSPSSPFVPSQIGTGSEAVDRFICHVQRLHNELQPLREWTETFQVSRKPQQIRRMISLCEEKLLAIKDEESKVTRLQLELEHLHMAPGLSARQLRAANDAFQVFNKGWARVVSKISEALNVLCGDSSHGEESTVSRAIQDWISSAENVLTEIARLPPSQIGDRLDKVAEQLSVQADSLRFIEKDKTKKAILAKGLDILRKKIDTLASEKKSALHQKLLNEMDGEWSSVGDIIALERDVQRSEKLVEEARKSGLSHLVEKAETRRAECLERKMVTVTAEQKIDEADRKIKRLKELVECMADGDTSSAARNLQKLREEMKEGESLKREAEIAAEKILSFHDKAPQHVVKRTKERVGKLVEEWKELSFRLDNDSHVAEKELRKVALKALGERQRTVEELEEAVRKSDSACDAEECSEYLDKLENLVERIASPDDSLSELIGGMEDTVVKDNFVKLSQSVELATEKAKQRIQQLATQANQAERFEQRAAELATWASHISQILALRLNSDISALDVPNEYKQMSREFKEQEKSLEEMAEFAREAANERADAQLEHAMKTFRDLQTHFAVFKQPVAFSHSVDRVCQVLGDMENALDDMVGLEVTACQEALGEAKSFQPRLAEVQEEIVSLETGRQKLLAEQFLSPGDAADIAERLKFAKKKTKELYLRAENTADRLEDCVRIEEKLREEARAVDEFLDGMEHRLNEFARSSDVSNASADDSAAVAEFVAEWNRHESSIKELEGLERTLREKGTRGTQQIFLSRRHRADSLKLLLDGWVNTLQAMEEDEESLLLQVDELHSNLTSKLDEAEKNFDDPQKLSSVLALLRNDRARLSSRVRRLCSLNRRLEPADLVGDINQRWKNLEEKLEEESGREKTEGASELPPSSVPPPVSLSDRLSSLSSRLHSARVYADLNKNPIGSVSEWQQRIQKLSDWLVTEKKAVQEAVEEGRRLAHSGSMELSTHQHLHSLDEIVRDAEQLDADIASARESSAKLVNEDERLRKDIESLEKMLGSILKADLSQPGAAKEAEAALCEREAQLQDVSRRASELHAALPGRASALRDSTLDNLNRILEEVDSRLGAVAKRENQEEMDEGDLEKRRVKESEKQETNESGESTGDLREDDEPLDVVETTATFTLPPPKMISQSPSLAMEVQETEKAKTSEDEVATKESDQEMEEEGPPPSIQVETIDAMGRMYVILDTMEDELTFDDEFPLENIDGADLRFHRMESQIEEASATLDQNAMTMDILESEHSSERIQDLRNQLADRKRKNQDAINEWQRFLQSVAEAEKNVGVLETEAEECGEGVSEEIRVQAEDSLCEAVRLLALILPRLPDNSLRAADAKDKVLRVEKRFRAVDGVLKEARAKREAESVDEAVLGKDIENLNVWCAKEGEIVVEETNSLDREALHEVLSRILRVLGEIGEKEKKLSQLEAGRDRVVTQKDMDSATKHAVRRGVSQAAKNLSDLRANFKDRRGSLEEAVNAANEFWQRLEETAEEAGELKAEAERVLQATLYTPSQAQVDDIRARVQRCMETASEIERRMDAALEEQAPLHNNIQTAIADVLEKCREATETASGVPDSRMAQSQSESGSAPSTPCEARGGGENIPATDNSDKPISVVEVAKEAESDEEMECLAVDPFQNAPSTSSAKEASQKKPELTDKELVALQALTQLTHWLNEAARDASAVIDIADGTAIKNGIANIQRVEEQLWEKQRQVVSFSDSNSSPVVRERATELLAEMARLVERVRRRGASLSSLSENTRLFEQLRTTMHIWLCDGDAILSRELSHAGREELRSELETVESLISQLDEKREKMREINKRADALIDQFNRDDVHSLSLAISRINTHWSSFNDNVRIRRAYLETSLRCRNDLQSALGELEEWMAKESTELSTLAEETANSQAIKDTAKRAEATQTYRAAHQEIQGHADMVAEVQQMGKRLLEALEAGKEKEKLRQRLFELDSNWEALAASDRAIGDRLEKAEEEWEKVKKNLSTLLQWTEARNVELASQQSLAGNLSTALAQVAASKQLGKEMEERAAPVKEALAGAAAYIMQNDLRPKMHCSNVLEDEDPQDAASAEKLRFGLSLRTDCERLRNSWTRLEQQHSEWAELVSATASRLQVLEKALAECQLGLSSLEKELEEAAPVEQLRLEQLRGAKREVDILGRKLDELRALVDDANSSCSAVLAADAPIDTHPRSQLEAVNQRYDALRKGIRVRVAAVSNALKHFGPSSDHFLAQSVALPWQRAISASNSLPYYIDHNTERTQWDHPVWAEMSRELAAFNRVKFIAYRTAMKLRALQKRLCLDLITLPHLEKAFSRIDLSHEESMSLEAMVAALVPLFEEIQHDHPHLIRSLALAVDLTINLLHNLYDPGRDGVLRTLSFKVALVVFSSAALEDKYRYLFSLVSQNEEADQKHCALLFYDLVHIPKLVGECAAFGGTNVEPTVRSLFERVRMAPSLSVSAFLAWLKHEPQSVVWLPVMHRFAAAEFAKHQAKCNVCKMFPVVGLRYRCLRCFNFDMCQNCFFSQRTAKNHKLKHPMQEYANPTTSGEDVRDFGRIVKNKLTGSKRDLGYMPIELVEEGRPLVTAAAKTQNTATEAVHSRVAAAATRIAQLTTSQVAEPARKEEVRSPIQIVNQVEMMQKDELDQLLQRLQLENIELKREVEKRKQAMQSQPELHSLRREKLSGAASDSMDGMRGSGRGEGRAGTLPRLGSSAANGRSIAALHASASTNDVSEEARLLRMHHARLEARSRLLSQQNEQLELQLSRVKKLIEKQRGSAHPTERDGGDDQLAAGEERRWQEGEEGVALHENGSHSLSSSRAQRMQCLLSTVDDLGRAIESLVVSVVNDSDSD